MRRDCFGPLRALVATCAAWSLQACSGAPPSLPLQAPGRAAPSFVLDVNAAVNALAGKPNRLWQDSAMTAPRVREAMKARASKGYGVEAAGVTWTNGLGGPCSSAPAFAKADAQNTTGPNPVPGDWVYVVLDSGQVQKINPATQAKTTANLGTLFSKSAVAVSGDNKRLYLTASNGTFFVLDANNLSTIWSGKISSAGFVGMRPFIDYSNGGGFPLGSDEHVIVMSADGSLYDVNVKGGPNGPYTTTVAAWTASNGTDQSAGLAAWTTKVNIPYGVAVTPGTTPVVWNNRAYWGTTTGTFYQVSFNETAPATVPGLNSWNLAQYTSAPAPAGKACSAVPALDYDNSLNVTAIFAPCGDRVCWIDPATSKVYDSPPLVVDKKPALPAQYNGQLNAFPYTTTTTTIALADWEGVAKTNPPTPSRWGNGGATTPMGAAVSCATIKQQPATGNMWVGQQTSPGLVQALSVVGAVVGNYTTTSNFVGEIAFDDSGNCFAAHYNGAGNSRIVDMLDPSGAVVRSFTYPAGKGNVIWPQPDHAGRLWVTGVSGNVTQFDVATGAVNFTKTLAGAFSLAVDASNNCFVSQGNPSGGSNQVTEYNSAGAVVRTFATTGPPVYLATEPATGNIWTANYTGNRVQSFNSTTGAMVANFSTVTRPWTIAFDQLGNPWVGNVQQGTNHVYRLDKTTGAISASYVVPGGGSAWEIAFDGNGDCWVSSDTGTFKLFQLGNLSDIFASGGFFNPADGNDSLGFLKFNIPANAYGGKAPIGAAVTLYAAATPPDGLNENLELYRTSPYLSDGTTLWKGYKVPASVNMDFNNRSPLFDSFPYATLSNQVINVGATFPYTFNLGLRHPTDSLNSSDAANAEYSYGVRSTGKALKNVVHWYSGSTAPAGQAPSLTVTLANGATLPNTNGIQCQPLVDSLTGHIYVLSANTVFELPYGSGNPDDFSDPAKVCYSLTQAGRSGGPVLGGKYRYTVGNISQNFYGDLFVADSDTTNAIFACRFTTPFATSPGAEHLAANFNAGPGTQSVSQALVWDYDKGSIYFTTNNQNLIRGTLY